MPAGIESAIPLAPAILGLIRVMCSDALDNGTAPSKCPFWHHDAELPQLLCQHLLDLRLVFRICGDHTKVETIIPGELGG